jgi:hypothetical protein
MVSILIQMHPIHTLPSYFPKIHSDLILSSTPMYSGHNLVCVSHLSQKIDSIFFFLAASFLCSDPVSVQKWTDVVAGPGDEVVSFITKTRNAVV